METYTPSNMTSDKTIYHSDPECGYLQLADRVVERSDSFISFHELDPCPRCCE